MDYRTIQQIAQGVVDTSAACDGQLFTGTVSNDNPLRISLGEESGSIELDGDDIILTQAVVSKKIYIKKHKHEEDESLVDMQGQYVSPGGPALVTFFQSGSPSPDPDDPAPPTILPLQHKHTIHTSTLDAWCTEYGHKLPVDPEDYDEDGEQTVITINRGLEKGDKVI